MPQIYETVRSFSLGLLVQKIQLLNAGWSLLELFEVGCVKVCWKAWNSIYSMSNIVTTRLKFAVVWWSLLCLDLLKGKKFCAKFIKCCHNVDEVCCAKVCLKAGNASSRKGQCCVKVCAVLRSLCCV